MALVIYLSVFNCNKSCGVCHDTKFNWKCNFNKHILWELAYTISLALPVVNHFVSVLLILELWYVGVFKWMGEEFAAGSFAVWLLQFIVWCCRKCCYYCRSV